MSTKKSTCPHTKNVHKHVDTVDNSYLCLLLLPQQMFPYLYYIPGAHSNHYISGAAMLQQMVFNGVKGCKIPGITAPGINLFHQIL